MSEQKRFLVIRDLADNEEIHRVEVTDKSDRDVEKVEMGIMRQWREGLVMDDVTE